MKRLYYVIQTLLRGRSSNTLKIISLTMGLFVGLLLFARIAFDLSYDTFYRDADKLFSINVVYDIPGIENFGPNNVILGPIAGAVAEAMPDVVESATVTQSMGLCVFYEAERRYEANMIMADSLFFRTMGIDLLQGNEQDMGMIGAVFISENMAKKIFGDENPVGKWLKQNKNRDLLVKGVYRDIPENSILHNLDAVLTMSTGQNWWGMKLRWNGGDSFKGYLRLYHPEDKDKVNANIMQIINLHAPEFQRTMRNIHYIVPINTLYSSNIEVQRMISIMFILAFAVFFIAAMNYVLISMSSLSQRAKLVGVHKCNGASNGTIFGMFLWETVVLILISLLLVAFLYYNFRGLIEETLEVSLTGLFIWQNLWVSLLVIIVLFLVVGVWPGWMFCNIPVSQVFQRYTEKRRTWKRPLLFVQFAGAAFILGLLVAVLFQYKYIVSRPLNFQPEGIAYVNCYFDNLENAKTNFRSLPMVERTGGSWGNILSGVSGEMVFDENQKPLFNVRTQHVDADYAPLMKLQIIEGRNIRSDGEILINETFVKFMHWTDTPVGKLVWLGGSDTPSRVVGVMKDFLSGDDFFSSRLPTVLVGELNVQSGFNVRLKEPYEQNIRLLNEKAKELYPRTDIVFTSMSQTLDQKYQGIRRFRDSVWIATISILLITLMGILGYTNDEVRRKSKEIALRKVNGAEAGDIIGLFTRNIVWTALPAVVLGAVASYLVGKKWIVQFADQIDLNIGIYIGVVLLVLFLIVGCVSLKSRKIANENPVNSIKSE